jgi:hypothetical protein
MEPANQGCGYLHIAARIPADAKGLIKPNVKAGGFAGLNPKSDGVRRSLPLSKVLTSRLKRGRLKHPSP